MSVYNDILAAIENGESVKLVLLDLSAAFDTVNHRILLQRLSKRFGITGMALRWLTSYLTDSTQFVSVNGASSQPLELSQGVP